MMKLYYRLTRNTRIIAENESLLVLKNIADEDARTHLEWKDFSDTDKLFEFAFNGSSLSRVEYELTSFKKRV